MADWDPFAVDEPAGPAAAAPKAAAPGAAGGGGGRISRADLQLLKEGYVQQVLSSDRPWAKVPDPTPDLGWYLPTCGFENWSHRSVKIELGQGIAYITLNQPEASNVLSASMYLGLCDAIFALHARKDIRCVVFSGEGKLFCGGADFKFDGNFLASKPPPRVAKIVEGLREKAAAAGESASVGRLLQAKLWFTMATLPQFSIALVNGSAMGDGLGPVACVDMVISVKSAFFAVPEVREGQVQCILAPYIVAKVGPGFAKYVFASGMNMTAQQMQTAGLVSEVVEDVEEGHKRIAEVCEVLTACGPRSVEAAKQLVFGVGGQPIEEKVMFYTASLLAMVTVSDEARDGMICVQAKKPKPWEETPIKPLR